jgi:DegV family protein with EDD domain
LVERVREATDTLYTLGTLKYLIHGGRISHLKGLMAQVLDLKPIIGVEKVEGKYASITQARTLEKAIRKIPEHIASMHPEGTPMRAQIMHAFNPDGAERLRESMNQLFKCEWLPVGPIAPVLGAHTGPTLVGVAYAPIATYPQLP